MENPKLSIIIVNYNSTDYLTKCLFSIFRDNQISKEVIVIDNASRDFNRNVVIDFPIKLICNNRNVGYSAANNIGINMAQGEYILLLNPDTELPVGCFRELIDYCAKNPQIGMIGPKLVKTDGTIDSSCRRNFPKRRDILFRLLSIDSLFPYSRIFNNYKPRFKTPDTPGEVECISGAFMLVRRRAVNEVGLLDERAFMYGEDVDWARRFTLAKWKIYYYPKVIVLHHKRGSSLRSTPDSIKYFYKANYLYYLKYYGENTNRIINKTFKILFNFRMILSLIVWRLFKKWI